MIRRFLLRWLLGAYGLDITVRDDTVYLGCSKRLAISAQALKVSGVRNLVLDGQLIDINNPAHRAHLFGEDNDAHAHLLRRAEAARIRQHPVPAQPLPSEVPHAKECSCAGS